MTLVPGLANVEAQQPDITKPYGQLPEVHPQSPGTLSRVLKSLQQISVMTHHKIKALADFAPARVLLQNQLCALSAP
ncbi:hypothetical protein [Arthrobacter sp. SLBN-112]|jgi:hypothetical protein|uniref:hypothetical protein n=1 Tax=Arthrobacter sp. SLBN-112 TaxID=2768452 RepID=UPI00190F281D|nr:hypothetical protein [Arthrobacter sp. SLBN-112]